MKNAHMGKLVEDYSAPARIRHKVIQICEEKHCEDVAHLCRKYGLDFNSVRYLCERSYKGIEVLIQICERCDVSADWLLGTEVNI